MEILPPLTAEEARTIDLPLNPIARVRKIGELASQTLPGVRVSELGMSPLKKLAYTRRGLINLAKLREYSVEYLASLGEVQESLEHIVDNKRSLIEKTDEVLNKREPYYGIWTEAEIEE